MVTTDNDPEYEVRNDCPVEERGMGLNEQYITKADNMNYLSLSLFSTLLALTFTGCGTKNIESTWASNPIVVDGDHGEWPASQLTYVEKVRGVFGATNDDSSLSVMFRFRDQRIARKVMMGGATVWWGQDGKKSKDFGVRYAAKFDIQGIYA